MDREYAAFISYRHLPLDMAVAAKLHRQLEAFAIPKALRRNGRRRLGLVFRDKEELPLTSSLSDDIHLALDHSQYLIVICTPDLLKSRYCLDEIDYFLKHHDRDHVLTVLASGEPDEAFPDAVRTAVDPDTGEVKDVEPLAANVVAPTVRGSLRLLDGEFLRLAAAMLGCPYDRLAQRQRRARRRRLALAAAVVVGVLAVYAGMLLVKNRQISDQLRQTQINESEALAYQSGQLLQQGYGLQAVETALRALPSEDVDRPVVNSAVAALANALHVYEPGAFVPEVRVDQDSRVSKALLSPDGRVLVTCSEDFDVRGFDTASGAPAWDGAVIDFYEDIGPAGENFVCTSGYGMNPTLVMGYDGQAVASLESGVYVPLEGSGDHFLIDHDQQDGNRVGLYDAKSCALEGSVFWSSAKAYSNAVKSACVSRDGAYCALLRRDYYEYASSLTDSIGYEIVILRLGSEMTACAEAAFTLPMPNVRAALAPLGASGFAFVCAEGVYRLEAGMEVPERVAGYSLSPDFSRDIRVLPGAAHTVCMTADACVELDSESGEVLWERAIEDMGAVLLAFWQDADEACARWVTGNGVLRGFMDRIYTQPTLEGEPFHVRALLEEQRLDMAYSHGCAPLKGGDRFALCPTQALQTVCVLTLAQDGDAQVISESFDGEYALLPWKVGEGLFIADRVGDAAALDGGRAFARQVDISGLRSGETEASTYEIRVSPQGEAGAGARVCTTTNGLLGISTDGSRLIGKRGAWELTDGAWTPAGESVVMPDVFDTSAKLFTASAYGERPYTQVLAREEANGGMSVEVWQDGQFAWKDRLPEDCAFYEADDPDFYTPEAEQIGLNGWAVIRVCDAAGERDWLTGVDAVNRRFSRFEPDDRMLFMAVGNVARTPLALALQMNGTLTLFNCETGARVGEYAFPLDPASTLSVRFVLDDRALLVQQRSNRMTLMDVYTGARLCSWMPDTGYNALADAEVAWSGDSLYLCMKSEYQQQYLGGVRVNAKGWSADLELKYLDRYLPAIDSLMLYDPTRTRQYLMPVCNVPALIEKGRAYIDARGVVSR